MNSTINLEEGRFVMPGDELCSGKYICGEGTYSLSSDKMFASLAGSIHIERSKDSTVVSVVSERTVTLPRLHSVVLAQVINVNLRICKVAILRVDSISVKSRLPGILRKEDVRATEKDSVELFNCFRPGDIMRARVISLGDGNAYSLSTAENELGVLFALSEDGHSMVPASWCEMLCTVTGRREKRKVAKVTNAELIPDDV